jgi:undecaprenyl-diphosphatase
LLKPFRLPLVLVSVLVLISGQAAADGFSLDWKKDLILGGLGGALTITSIAMPEKSIAQKSYYDKNDVPAIDRWGVFAHKQPWDNITDNAVYATVLVPLSFAIAKWGDTKQALAYPVMYAESFLLSFGTVQILKHAVGRNRPYMYENKGVPAGQDDEFNKSFPSGASAYSFLAAGFVTAAFLWDFPGSNWKIPAIAGTYAFAAAVGAARIATGAHFFSDVVVGAAIGSLFGYLVPFLHRKINDNNSTSGHAAALRPAPAGMVFSFQW